MGMSQSRILESAFYKWREGLDGYKITLQLPECEKITYTVYARTRESAIDKASKIASEDSGHPPIFIKHLTSVLI